MTFNKQVPFSSRKILSHAEALCSNCRAGLVVKAAGLCT